MWQNFLLFRLNNLQDFEISCDLALEWDYIWIFIQSSVYDKQTWLRSLSLNKSSNMKLTQSWNACDLRFVYRVTKSKDRMFIFQKVPVTYFLSIWFLHCLFVDTLNSDWHQISCCLHPCDQISLSACTVSVIPALDCAGHEWLSASIHSVCYCAQFTVPSFQFQHNCVKCSATCSF